MADKSLNSRVAGLFDMDGEVETPAKASASPSAPSVADEGDFTVITPARSREQKTPVTQGQVRSNVQRTEGTQTARQRTAGTSGTRQQNGSRSSAAARNHSSGQRAESNRLPGKTAAARSTSRNGAAHRSSSRKKSGSKEALPAWRIYGHWLIFPFILVYSDLFMMIFTGAGNRAFGLTFLFDIAFGLLLSAITSLFKTKTNRKITLIIMLVLVIYFSLHSTIYTSFQTYMSFKDIAVGTRQVMGGYASNAISAAIAALPKVFVFAIPGILYFIWGKKYLRPRRFKWPAAVAMVILSLAIFGITMLFSAIGGFSNVYAKDYKFDTAVRTYGLMTASRLDLKYLIFGNNSGKGFTGGTANQTETETTTEDETALSDVAEAQTDENGEAIPAQPVVYGKNIIEGIDFATAAELGGSGVSELNSYVQSLSASSQNAYTGLFKGKNLILICAEAFSDAVIDPVLTPTLYRMAHNGIYFSNFYQPAWGGSTITGEYSFLMGLAPYASVEVNLDVQYNNNYFTLGNQLQRLDYYNIAFHNGDYDFYSRQYSHRNFGYEKFLGYGNGMEDVGGAWLPDSQHLPLTLETYMNDTPFSVYYMTLSGHASYLADKYFVEWYYDTVNSIVGDKYEETTKYYLCYQYDLELGLQAMIEKLEEAGIADDTVIVMTGDHYPYGLAGSDTWGNDKDYITDLYQGPDTMEWERDHNAWILWSGCLENEYKDMAVEVSAPTFTLDIVPTLSNLFGLEYDSRLLVGRDVFSDQEPIIFWTTHSWITEKGKYDSEDGQFYPADGQTADDAYIARINDIVSDKIYFSYQVADLDYYAYLFGPDTSVGREVPYYSYLD